MAKNWSAAEAAKVIVEGTDKAAIQDIGKRFPLFLHSASRGTEGLLEIIGVLHPERITARTIEAKLKEDVGELEDEDDAPEEKAPTKKAPAKGKAAPSKSKSKARVEEDEDEDEEDEEEAPKSKSKAKGKAAPPAKGKGKKAPEPEEEDEDEDDEDEDDDGYDDMSLAELRKEAKRQKINIAGLKTSEQIIAALRGEEDEDEEDEDEDDWDI